jgi:hypothetical protein
MWHLEDFTNGKFYSTLEFSDTEPSGSGVRSVKEASFGLSGITFQAGIRIRL